MSQLVWKIYDNQGTFCASCMYSEDAAALVGLHGDGATIRWNHKFIVWREGSEEVPANGYYDLAGTIIRERVAVHNHRAAARS